MVHRAILGLAVLLTTVVVGAPRAHADLRICNTADYRITVAIGYVDRQQGWVGEGWWVVDAGGCKVTISTPLDNRYYYFYAMGLDDHSKTKFTGDTSFCVQFEAFKLYQAKYGKNTEADCAGAGLDFAKFRKMDTNNKPNYTITLKVDDSEQGASAAPAPRPAPVIQPAPPIQQRGPAPPAPPAGAGAGTACQRFPNLC